MLMFQRNSYILLFFFSATLLTSCRPEFKPSDNPLEKHNTQTENIFADPIIQEINAYKYERNAGKLIGYIQSEYPEYRLEAAKAFASVEAPIAIPLLLNLLTDNDKKIAMAAAFALGQTTDPNNKYQLTEKLIETYNEIPHDEIKAEILIAIAKQANERGLHFIVSTPMQNADKTLQIGQAKALAYLATKALFSAKATELVFGYIASDNTNIKAAYYASFYLTQASNTDFSGYLNTIINAYRNPQHFIFTKINLIKALTFCENDQKINFIAEILATNTDYRIKINAIRALYNTDYNKASPEIFALLTHPNNHVSVAAAQFFETNGTKADAKKYFELTKKIKHWRTRSIMVANALKFSDNKTNISNAIISAYLAAQNNYEKAFLLKALGGDPEQYRWVEKQIFESNEYLPKTYGIEAIVNMRKHPSFIQIHKKKLQTENINLKDEFAIIFKKAIQSRDVSLIAQSCIAIRDPELQLKTAFDNTYFLTQALNQSVLPRDIESYIELQKTIAYINNTPPGNNPKLLTRTISWETLDTIKPNQKVLIKTTKGNLVVQLFVEKAPATVANFLELIKTDYFKQLSFHRVVPNFVAQTGCFRGDGWGTPSYTIPSEFSDLEYNEGTLGMASAGKDTESSQWFITHSPQMHLNGKYTIFGEIVDGMDVVHQLEIEDQLLELSIL